MVRRAVFAGRFYPADPQDCRAAAELLFDDVKAPAAMGAIAPHAGWVYSGAVAARAIRAIADYAPECVVIFGAVHAPVRHEVSVYHHGAWEIPLGSLTIDAEVSAALCATGKFLPDPDAHRFEHSIEVQLPLLKHVLPEVRIVPVGVRPCQAAASIGAVAAEAVQKTSRKVAYLASTDLTHYGPAFGFEPAGRGAAGVRWAKGTNDRRFVHLVAELDSEALVPEAEQHQNACGAGAVAALVGVMRRLGQTRFVELAHTCSADVKLIEAAEEANSVGYLAGVFLMPE